MFIDIAHNFEYTATPLEVVLKSYFQRTRQNNGNPWIAKITHLNGFAHNTFMAVTPTARDAQLLKEEGTFVIATSVLWDSFGAHRMKTDPEGVPGGRSNQSADNQCRPAALPEEPQ